MIILQPYIYEIVRKLVQKRIDERKFPFIATTNDIVSLVTKDVKETLKEMEQDGLITHNENINGVMMFRPINPPMRYEEDNV